MPAMRSKAFARGFTAVWISAVLAGQTPSPPAKSRRVEIDARGQVVSEPRRPAGKAGRQLLEFEIELLAYMLAPEQPAGADRSVPVDMTGRVRVLHDLSCGGGDLALAVGDKVELRGVYVTAESGSLIRFTHAPGGEGCGDKAHPAGHLREVFPVTPTPAVTPPRPAVIVPDQSYVGTPAASEKAYVEILRMKQAGASNEKLLEKIAAEKKVYSMSLEDIQKLRGAGMSTAVIEAMLQSGRRPITPGRKPAPSPTPGS
jgi:hypothetical protein